MRRECGWCLCVGGRRRRRGRESRRALGERGVSFCISFCICAGGDCGGAESRKLGGVDSTRARLSGLGFVSSSGSRLSMVEEMKKVESRIPRVMSVTTCD